MRLTKNLYYAIALSLMLIVSIGSAEILELGGATAYPKAVTYNNEEFLPAATVYRGVYATGNSTGSSLQLQVL